MGSFSIWHWIVVLVIVMLIFGTKKISSMGADIGKALKGFKEGINDIDETSRSKVEILPANEEEKEVTNASLEEKAQN